MLRRTSDVMLSVYLSRALLPLCKGQVQRQLHLEETSCESQLFIKNLFMGKFNNRLFDFPRVESEALSDLEVMADSVEKFMEEVDSQKIDAEAKIPEGTLKTLAEMGLFGQQVPTEYGGLGLDAMRYGRLMEVTARDGAISTTLAAHQSLGLKGLLLAGTPEQKQKYLPRLAAGTDLAAFCLSEADSGSDAQAVETWAELSDDGTHYILNGKKAWVSNGSFASVMTVFAKTVVTDPDGQMRDPLTAFIVERDFGGVTSGAPVDKLGIRGANTCSITFENTPVPLENVLGEVGKGFKLAMNILSAHRLSMGACAIGAAKHLLKDSVEYALSREQFGRPIGQFPLIKEKVAKIAADIYAMESMTYLTAGLTETCGDSVLSLEAAAVKIFCSEALWRAADESLQIYGGLGYTKDYQQERCLRDARVGHIFGGTNEVLRVTIAGSGLKHAGMLQRSDLRKLHKPQENVFFHFRRRLDMSGIRFEARHQRSGALVHPFMAGHMQEVSKRAHFFSYAVPEVLVWHGHKTIEHQMTLRRVADMAVDLYMCCAVISRCSQALAEQRDNVAHEVDLATAILKEALERTDRNNVRLARGQEIMSDEEEVHVADRILRDGGYCAFHPLTRNW